MVGLLIAVVILVAMIGFETAHISRELKAIRQDVEECLRKLRSSLR